MFKKWKYKISFYKKYKYLGYGTWTEVNDYTIVNVLNYLQDKYKFKIISVSLENCFHKSKIVIKCNRSDKDKIFIDFINKLSGDVENVHM